MKIAVLFLSLLLIASCDRPPTGEPDHSRHDHTNANITPDHSKMDHSAMNSSAGAAEAPRELQFIDTMIVHHQGAVDMAQLVNTRTQRPEMQKMAADIIAEQRKEIDQMKAWRDQWFAGAPPAVNMDFPGMHTGMSGMDMGKLDQLKAGEFDAEFLRQMIPHHEGAVEMAKALGTDGQHQELKDLAASITRSQTAEIAQMKTWLETWRTPTDQK